jgi:hypothetical protein
VAKKGFVMIDYVTNDSPITAKVPIPPKGALCWDQVNGLLYGSVPGSGEWFLIGGGVPATIVPSEAAVPVISQRLQVINTTTPQSVSLTPPTTQMVALSLYGSSAGTGASGHEVIITINYSCELGPETITVSIPLDSRTIVMETYPLLVIGGTTITLSTAYSGGATNDPYNLDVRLVQMP